MDVRAEQRAEIARRKKAGVKSPLSETREAEMNKALSANKKRVEEKKAKEKEDSAPVRVVKEWMREQNAEFTGLFNKKHDKIGE